MLYLVLCKVILSEQIIVQTLMNQGIQCLPNLSTCLVVSSTHMIIADDFLSSADILCKEHVPISGPDLDPIRIHRRFI